MISEVYQIWYHLNISTKKNQERNNSYRAIDKINLEENVVKIMRP